MIFERRTAKTMFQQFVFSKNSQFSVLIYRIKNSKNEYVDILNYGAVVHKICVLDRTGKLVDVALGYASADQYNNRGTYFGSVIGRVANRVSGCSFSLCGKTYSLFDTGGGVSLHGGKVGFNNKLFSLIEDECSSNSITLGLFSEDCEEGYPGNLSLKVKYTLTDESALVIDYLASVDHSSVFNPTNHTYFNLAGHDSGESALETLLQINSAYVTPLGGDFTPDGTFLNVKNTPFDFSAPKPIGKDIDMKNAQLVLAGGYDINYVLDPYNGISLHASAAIADARSDLNTAAFAYSKSSGIAMLVQTSLPCMQFYSGNFLEKVNGKDNAPYDYRFGFCLETQLYPDAMNKKTFPSVTVFPGDGYRSTTVYSFGTVK